jgi:HAD superfamily hydrolase (TIGR01490 family)
LRTRFVERRLAPIVAPGAPHLLTRPRKAGDHLMLITATNRFVTAPIPEMLGVDTLIATEPAMNGKHYTGEVEGTPSFREGKVARLEQWLDENDMSLAGATFYSDSRNDLPLLEMVDNPVAVDPDPVLREVAEQRDWPIISLRGKG